MLVMLTRQLILLTAGEGSIEDEELTAQAEAVFRGVDNIVAESDDNADL